MISRAGAVARLTIATAQCNPLVGDIEGNTRLVIDLALRARDEFAAQIVVFPELTLTGYPPEDLLLRPRLFDRVDMALTELAREITGIRAAIGYPLRAQDGVFNACSLIGDGQESGRYAKQILPNYSVFDEKRYFIAGTEPMLADVQGIRVALTICEDIWVAAPMAQARAAGARLMLNLNASPYHASKGGERETLLAMRAREGDMPIVYANQVGGQDELVFDGQSMVVAADGTLMHRAPAFRDDLSAITFNGDGDGALTPERGNQPPELAFEAEIYAAVCLGVKDYVHKNGFKGAVIGLSGGIDSALTLAIACDALGAAEVTSVAMPSRYTADMSLKDAAEQARRCGVTHHVVPIEPAFDAFLDLLAPVFAGYATDATEENIQARCRGVILMAISNKIGAMVLTTGNKSEMAVGYATLYGDMAGGFAPLKDVPKSLVYRLANWRNRQQAVIPERVITRPPSAELAPDQVDQDSLPPYDVLDPVLEMLVEQDLATHEVAARGYDAQMVERVAAMVVRNEYKRRQAAPGVRITRRAFGRDRRYPITSGYRM